MIYVPDTNILVARLNGSLTIATLKALRPEEVVLSAPVLAELRFGASLSARRQENLDLAFQWLPWDVGENRATRQAGAGPARRRSGRLC